MSYHIVSYILSVSVACYPACKSHAPYFHPWPFRVYRTILSGCGVPTFLRNVFLFSSETRILVYKFSTNCPESFQSDKVAIPDNWKSPDNLNTKAIASKKTYFYLQLLATLRLHFHFFVLSVVSLVCVLILDLQITQIRIGNQKRPVGVCVVNTVKEN